jgi:hypothetical protein
MALPVETNPYIVQHIEFKEQEKRILLASHRLEVEGIYPWGRHANEALFESVRRYCNSHRIEFGLREFKSEAFWQDRECIVQLPAFHIYYDEEYRKTFYLEDSPVAAIEEVLNEEKRPPPKRKTTFWFPSFTWFPKKRKMASSG